MAGISTYTPEIAQAIFDKMSLGFTLVAAAADQNIGRQTIYDWLEKYPEFKAIYDVAKGKRQLYLENELLTTVLPARVTASLKALGSTKSPEWSETQTVELTGAGGAPLFEAIQWKVIDGKEPLVIDHQSDDDD